jgi:hypothetical protein
VPAAVERAAELGESGEGRHEPDAGDRTASDRTAEKISQLREACHEKVPVPERRPWGHDENQPGFEKIGGEQQARDKRDDQPPDIPANRSVRAATSRYSVPSA